MKTRFAFQLAFVGILPLACGGSGDDDALHPADAMPRTADAAPSTTADAATSTTPDANSTDAGTNPELGDLMPQAVPTDTSAILAHPVIVPISYSDDPNEADINTYYGAFGASAAWAAQTAEYGVNAMTQGTPRSLGTMPTGASASVTLSQLLNVLKTNLTASKWGVPDPSSVYAFHIPSTVQFNDGFTKNACCSNYDGYHDDTTINGVDVAYAINCECPSEAQYFGITLFQDMGVTMSHEAIEASTDPFVEETLAWGQTDDAHAAWSYATGGELGDLCEFADTANWLDAVEPAGYAVQRTWSNEAAKAGHDPCVGNPTTPYYTTIPTDPDSASVSIGYPDAAGNMSWSAKGTKVAVGASGTISMKVLSDVASSGPYKVAIADLNSWLGNSTAYLQFGTVTGTFMPGDTATVSVTVNAKDPNLSGGEAYVIETSAVSGTGPTTYYFALVVQ